MTICVIEQRAGRHTKDIVGETTRTLRRTWFGFLVLVFLFQQFFVFLAFTFDLENGFGAWTSTGINHLKHKTSNMYRTVPKGK